MNAPNMEPSPLAVGVITLVSEQTLPNLSFLLHLADHYGERLKFMGLYHTGDKSRSQEPAERLQRTLLSWGTQRALGFDIEVCEGNGRADDVRAGLEDWFEQRTDVNHWIVNATLGMKPMSVAAYQISRGASPIGRVLYLEVSGQWFEWGEDDAGFLVDRKLEAGDPEVPAPDALDRLIPIKDIAGTQFALPDSRIEVARDPPLGETTLAQTIRRAGRGGQWHWALAAGTTGQGSRQSSGLGFERFVVAGLRQMGLLAERSLTGISATNQSLAEVDVVVIRNGRVYCLDLKLPDQEDARERGNQLSKCAIDARQFFGSAAVPIALRPGWRRAESKAAEDQARALNVRLLMQEDMRGIFSALKHLIDDSLALTPDLQAVEAYLAECPHLTVISNMRRIHGGMDHEVYPLAVAAELAMDTRGRPWCVMRAAPAVHLLVLRMNRPADWYGTAWPEREGDERRRLKDQLKEAIVDTLRRRLGANLWRDTLVRTDATWIWTFHQEGNGQKGQAIDATLEGLWRWLSRTS